MTLKFKNADTKFTIFISWNDEDGSSDFGLEIQTTKAKAKRLSVDKLRLTGSLIRLNDIPQIKNEAEE